MAERCAVVGIGQTHHRKVRDDVSLAGMLREAGQRALDDAEMTWRDIDAVVIGTAPDSFEGVMMPEIYLADALGAAGKPIMRVHTAGSVGGSTAIVATHLVQSGVRKRVLTIAFEKQSEGDTTWGLSGGRSGGVGAGGYFAPHIRAYIERSGAPEHVGWMVAVKDRLNALNNPYAHLKVPDITLETVRDSPMVWEPVRRLESCPASDGACALVLTDEAVRSLDPNVKMNPPLRAPDDRAALRDALRRGSISCIATDHAPHARHEKEVPFEEAPFGVTGLETAFAALYTHLVLPGELALETLLERMSAGPARVFGLDQPRIEVGAPANLVELDLDAEWEVREDAFRSRSVNSWLLGETLRGRVVRTIAGGRLVHSLLAESVP